VLVSVSSAWAADLGRSRVWIAGILISLGLG
jgi:hypothetical protein